MTDVSVISNSYVLQN